jgi:Family of unknown function (DUF6152)
MNLSPTTLRTLVASALLTCLSTTAFAHHGIGLYQPQINSEWSGTLTKMNLVNPHSYMELDVTKADGSIQHIRCEMRAATLIKRSGWSADMFKVGVHVDLKGHPHRDDPGACYIESFSIDGSATMGRNDTLSSVQPVDTSNRPLRLADGQLNISGDWAVEQMLLTISPEGDRLMIPASQSADVASGKITREQLRAQQQPRERMVRTPVGEAEAKGFDSRSPQDNPWFACKPTSLIRDWTADWPINQFIQTTTAEGEQIIDITYGLYNFKRLIHVGMKDHPADITPSYAGHSIGNWEGDTLVVDTIGFEQGVLSPPTRSSSRLHIVERFSLDTAKMALKREYTVTDPIYLAEPFESFDEMYLAETPFEAQVCQEMTPEFQQ